MAKETEYGAFRLKKDTVDNLRVLKKAFELSYGEDFTNDEFIQQMAAAVEEGDEAVWEIYCELNSKLIELRDKAQKKREATA